MQGSPPVAGSPARSTAASNAACTTQDALSAGATSIRSASARRITADMLVSCRLQDILACCEVTLDAKSLASVGVVEDTFILEAKHALDMSVVEGFTHRFAFAGVSCWRGMAAGSQEQE